MKNLSKNLSKQNSDPCDLDSIPMIVLSASGVDVCGSMILIGMWLHSFGISAAVVSVGLSSSYQGLSNMYIAFGEMFLLFFGFVFILSVMFSVGEWAVNKWWNI